MRLLLSGRSVIDWYRIDLKSHAEVYRFLRVNEFDPESEDDMARLQELRLDAVDYLTRNFDLSVPDDVAYSVPTRDLFLIASRDGAHQRWACAVLKLMHIIHHLAGRELMTRLPITDEAVFKVVELKVIEVVEELRAAGYPIVEFEWSRKARSSLMTKLLAKRSTLAAKIYDKLRFRLIVKEHADLLPTLAVLTRQLIPFNYIIPGESVNNLVSFPDEVGASDILRTYEAGLKREASADRLTAAGNEFSGANFRTVNFVADLPVRLDALIDGDDAPVGHGHVVFVLSEFQIADKATVEHNERGEANHALYKERQRTKVYERLFNGPGTPNS